MDRILQCVPFILSRKITTHDASEVDFGFLCMPELPFSMGGTKRRRATPFYALDQPMPILLALICGSVSLSPPSSSLSSLDILGSNMHLLC